jgi:hypothetical protein
MAYKIEYDENAGGITTIFSGTVTDEDLINSGRDKITQIDKVKTYKYLVSDFSDVDEFKITPDGIRANAKIAIHASKYHSRVLLVAILPTDLEYGMGRMWQVYSEESGMTTFMARSHQEADYWLKQKLGAHPQDIC